MKILFTTHRYHPHIGGVETHIKNIAERLAKRGYEIEVYTADRKKELLTEENINNIRVKRFRSFAPNNAYYLPTINMLHALKNTDAHIVHAHNIQAFPMLYTCLAKNNNSKLILTMHTGASTRFRNILFSIYLALIRNQIIKKADVIISVSEFEKDIIVSKLNVDPSKVIVIPNGINEDILNLKRIDDEFTLLSVGRLERFKNFDKVIEALHILHKRYGLKDARLTIVGKGSDKDRLIKMIKSFNLNDYVTIKSDLSREELLREYAKAKIFLLPSEYESYGIAAVEAIALRIPTIVNNRSALREFVDDGSAIGIDPPITGDKVADAIVKAVNFRPLNANGRIITWDKVVDKLEKVYKGLC